MFIISCICFNELSEDKKISGEKKSAVDFNAMITRSSFQVHIRGGKLMKFSREISRFHFRNFSTLYKDAAGVGSGEEFWVNIDPVNMCAVHTLPVSPFLFLSLLSERRTLPAASMGAS